MLDDMGAAFNALARRNGFWDNPNKAEKIALMHSELSECLEYIRKPAFDKHCPTLSGEVVELADALIRILDYCYQYELPIDEAVREKHKINLQRPYKHGKAF